MSFKFDWTIFDDAFYAFAKGYLEALLNEVPKPANICAPLAVRDFYLGSTSPELEIVEIVDLGLDRFRSILRVVYRGDAYLVLQTKVQANPVNTAHHSAKQASSGTRLSKDGAAFSGILAANKPLIVPLLLRLTDLRLDGLFRLSLSSTHGLTLAFINDPLRSIQVSSSFDSLPKLRDHLQTEIEQKIRDALLLDLPKSLHESSLIWLHRLATQARREPPMANDMHALRDFTVAPLARRPAGSAGLVKGTSSPMGSLSSPLQWRLTSTTTTTTTTTTQHSLTLVTASETARAASTAAISSSTSRVSSKECIVLDHPIFLSSGSDLDSDSDSYARFLLSSGAPTSPPLSRPSKAASASATADSGLLSLLVSTSDEIQASIALASHGIADRRLSSYFFWPAASESELGRPLARRKASLSHSTASTTTGSRPGIFSSYDHSTSVPSSLFPRLPLFYHAGHLRAATITTEPERWMNEHFFTLFSTPGSALPRPATASRQALRQGGLQALLEGEEHEQAHESKGESLSLSRASSRLEHAEPTADSSTAQAGLEDPSILFSWTSKSGHARFTLFHRKNK